MVEKFEVFTSTVVIGGRERSDEKVRGLELYTGFVLIFINTRPEMSALRTQSQAGEGPG